MMQNKMLPPLLAQQPSESLVADKRKNIEWIDAAKGVCILLVVLYHVIIVSYHLPGLEANTPLEQRFFQFYTFFNRNLTPLRMPLFFMLSGLLAKRAIFSGSWAAITQNRVINYLWLYLLWGCIQWTCVTVAHHFTQFPVVARNDNNAIYATNALEILKLISIGSSSLWYLYALPMYFIICKNFSNHPKIAILILLTMHAIGRIESISWSTASILSNSIYFGIGCFYGPKLVKLFHHPTKKNISLLLVPLIFTLFFGLFGKWRELPTSLVFLAVAIMFFHAVTIKFRLSVLQWIGKHTMPIYVIHRILLELVRVFLIPYFQHLAPSKQQFAIFWWAFYPVLATIFITSVCIALWSLTNRGFGKYLYLAPNISKPIISSEISK